jgi:integral membrane protein
MSPIGRLRAVGLAEGASFLVLLGIAMPLKYFAGLPLAVKIAGWIHGTLFILFCVALSQATTAANWSYRRAAGLVVAALLPFGTFVVDKRLRDEDARYQGSKQS